MIIRITILCLLLGASQALADGVPLPPTHKTPPASAVHHADEVTTEDEVDLRKSLTPEHIDKDVEIRSYIRKRDQAEITEYSRQGRVYMIKVDPAGDAPPYYLYDEDGDGHFRKRLPGNYKPLTPPTWEVKKF